MAECSTGSKIPKPQLRGLLHAQIKRNLTVVGVSVFAAFIYMKFVYGNGQKRAYAEFYRQYEIEEEFERMRQKGLFDSCDIE